jgi:HD superfamily phosphohydrolase
LKDTIYFPMLHHTLCEFPHNHGVDMKYIDRVYGEFEINESIILDLMESDALKRLKKIDQAGYRPAWVQPDLKISELDHSRFAHSTGVYLLLRQYNASLEEQISGLIHDVSHSAFSHCIDYVFKKQKSREYSSGMGLIRI